MVQKKNNYPIILTSFVYLFKKWTSKVKEDTLFRDKIKKVIFPCWEENVGALADSTEAIIIDGGLGL